MEPTKIFVASPQDAEPERIEAERVVREISISAEVGSPLRNISSTDWKLEVPPGLRGESIQAYVDRTLHPEEHDIILVIFRRRIGSDLKPGGPTGTEHELANALDSRIQRGRPWTMVYFDATPSMPGGEEERLQLDALLRLKFSLRRQELDVREYKGIDDFRLQLRAHLPKVVQEYRRTIDNFFDKRRYEQSITTGTDYSCLQLGPELGSSKFSSFSVDNKDRPFRRAYIATTAGWILPKPGDDSVARTTLTRMNHHIYVIRDPIRPFEIQIGEYRTRRYGREPREVPFEGVPRLDELIASYPALMLAPHHRWLRMVLAELVSDPLALDYMDRAERAVENKDEQILGVIARNPSAPDPLRERECRFCDFHFQERRRHPQSSQDSIIIQNDFPFGPYFHYVVFPRQPVHSWDEIEETHLSGMNHVVYRLLHDRYDEERKTCMRAAGIRMGFNSSIRHLVMGRRTRSSAGASIAHAHKQVWGMPAGSVNLADQLRDLCLAHEARGYDYLGSYLEALKQARLILWSDDHVVLYVPFGQIALHELQIMVRRPTRTFLDLKAEEIDSLSKAEYVVARLYGKLDVNSFNEIMLSLPFDDERSTTFRLIFTFITREVDLAMSELSLLYVVDQHPSDTMKEVARVWPSREFADLREKVRPVSDPSSDFQE